MNLLHSHKGTILSFLFFSAMVFTNKLFSQQLKPIAQLVQNAKSSKSFTALKPFSTLATRESDQQKKFPNYLKEETVVRMNSATLDRLYDNNTGAISLTIPFKNKEIEMELVEQKNVWDGFQVKTSESEDKAVPYEKGKFYRGIIKGDNESVVAISVFKNEIMGIISNDSMGNVVLAKAKNDATDNAYLMYAENDLLIHNSSACETADVDERNPIPTLSTRGDESNTSSKWIRIYLECDYNLFQKKDSSIANTVNYIAGAFNNVAALYMNENISVAISEVFVWTSPAPYSRSSASSALSQFRTKRPVINGDLGQLISCGGASGGVAYVNTICKPVLRYSYCNIFDTYTDFNTFSWTVLVMAHELGHNLGSNHTQWCGWQGGPIDNCYTQEGSCSPGPAPLSGGTIMSYCHISQYGTNFKNGLGKQPGDVIRNAVANALCLGSSPTCSVPSTPVYSNITMTSTDINWQPVTDAIGYQVEYKKLNTTVWTIAKTTTAGITLSNLPILDTFQVRISTICNDGMSGASAITGFRTLNNLKCTNEQTPSVSGITNTSTKVNWVNIPGATNYLFEYRVSQSPTWKNETLSKPTLSLNNLIGGQIYQVRVTATCTDITGQSSSEISFITLNNGVIKNTKSRDLTSLTTTREISTDNPTIISDCVINDAPTIESIEADNTVVSWTNLDEVNYYIVQYKLENSKNWSSTTVLTNTITLKNLFHKQTYQVCVMPVCNRIKGAPSPIRSFAVEPQGLIYSNEKANIQYNIYPNPTNGVLKLQIDSPKEGEAQVSILDATGRLVNTQPLVTIEVGMQTQDIDLTNLNNGIYFIRIANKEKVEVKKFLLMRR